MLKKHIFQKLSLHQWVWIWSAYWRLWPILLRIKFKQLFSNANWFRKKVTLVQRQIENSASNSLVAIQMHESVRLAARLHFYKAECLSKSIVLADMLSSRAMKASVVIGVAKKNKKFSSHAWVELDGLMVCEPESVREEFTVLKH